MKVFRTQFALLIVVVTLCPLAAIAADIGATWPPWRGPSRNGQATLTPVWPESVDESTLVKEWQVELGPSYSGPIVADIL